jgi:hypothetical protein
MLNPPVGQYAYPPGPRSGPTAPLSTEIGGTCEDEFICSPCIPIEPDVSKWTPGLLDRDIPVRVMLVSLAPGYQAHGTCTLLIVDYAGPPAMSASHME